MGSVKYIIIPVVIIGIIFAIGVAPEQEMSLPKISDLFVDDGIYQISISEIPSFADKGKIGRASCGERV